MIKDMHPSQYLRIRYKISDRRKEEVPVFKNCIYIFEDPTQVELVIDFLLVKDIRDNFRLLNQKDEENDPIVRLCKPKVKPQSFIIPPEKGETLEAYQIRCQEKRLEIASHNFIHFAPTRDEALKKRKYLEESLGYSFEIADYSYMKIEQA